MNFKSIDGKNQVEGYCLIKSVDKKTSSKGDTYLDFTLSDSDGEINGKLWNYNENIHGVYDANILVKVRGTISVYNGADQFRVERIRPVNDEDGVKIEDFVKSAGYDSSAMYNALFEIASSFEDKELSLLVTTILNDRRLSLLYWPAAFKLHHAIRGGLLLHTLSIVRLCEKLCGIYSFVNKELLISGAILHDIAKIDEFEVAESGIATGYSVKGNLIGHLAEGAIVVREAANKAGVSEETSNLIEHMLLSHHGDPEFGAAVRPMFMEAEILSELDMLDARIYEMKEAVEGVNSGDFTGRLWSMDNRKLYNHGKSDLNKPTILF
ncbi:MAG: HD domain-containing protein [Acutalibacteraceae bacterium]|nr:HD domain-containing protein [Acutalibacteraceae bacterium]